MLYLYFHVPLLLLKAQFTSLFKTKPIQTENPPASDTTTIHRQTKGVSRERKRENQCASHSNCFAVNNMPHEIDKSSARPRRIVNRFRKMIDGSGRRIPPREYSFTQISLWGRRIRPRSTRSRNPVCVCFLCVFATSTPSPDWFPVTQIGPEKFYGKQKHPTNGSCWESL